MMRQKNRCLDMIQRRPKIRNLPPLRRWSLRALIGLIVLIGVGHVGEFAYRVWAARFPELLESGTEIDGFFGVLSKNFQAMDAEGTLKAYRAGAEIEFFTRLEDSTLVDGVQTASFVRAESGEALPSARAQLDEYFSSVASMEKAKFKLNRLYELEENRRADVRIRFQIWGDRVDGLTFYDFGHLEAELERTDDGEWSIRAQRLLDAQRVIRSATTYFTDVSESSGLDLPPSPMCEFEAKVEDWRFSSVTRLGRGSGTADIDMDGDLDICLADLDAARIFLNDGQGQFVDGSDEVGLSATETDWSLFPLFADLDGDEDPDLLVLRYFGESRLFRNDGGRFVDVTATSGLDAIGEFAFSAAFADYDGDGNLDLYVGRYGNARDTVPDNLLRSVNGEPDQLFRGDGRLGFEDVSEEAGIRNPGWTLAVSMCDIDSDGDVDAYAANDFGSNVLYINQGDGTFEDRSFESGAHDIGNSMSVTFADYDEDGDLDLYTSAIASNTIWFQGPSTNWILSQFLRTPSTFSATFSTVTDLVSNLSYEEIDQLGYKITQGNSLLENQGDGTFRHVERETGTYWAEWAWGASAEDFDCDGDTDFYVANGFISGPDTHDL